MNEKAVEVCKIRSGYPDSQFASGNKASAIRYINKAITLAKNSEYKNLSEYFYKLTRYEKNYKR